MKTKNKFLFFILIFSLFSFSQSEVKRKEITLVKGIDQTIKIDFPFSTNITLGDKEVIKVDVFPDAQKLNLVGLKEGKTTSMTIRDKSGNEKIRYIISVTENDQSKTLTELKDLLGEIEGLEIGVKGGKVFVGGHIVVPSDIGKVATVLINYPDVLRMVEMHPQTQRIIARKMTEELARFNLKNASVRVVNHAYWVEGVVNSQGEEELAKRITKALLPEKIESLSSSSDRLLVNKDKGEIYYYLSVNQKKKKKKEPLPKQVKISSQFVELTKDYSKIFGFKWSPLLNNDGGSINIGKTENGSLGARSSGTFSAIISNLFPKIQSLKNAGYGRVIQSGMVITQENVTGSVAKSTKIPFLLGSGDNARGAEADVNFTLGVTPTVLQDENIQIKIDLNVSVPSGTSSSGAPIVASNSVKTQLYIKSGQSAALGGIVQSNDVTGFDKNDPAPVGDDNSNKVFFNLLRSKSRSIAKNQYVVFITPELIQSASEGTKEIRRKFRRRR